MSEGNIPSPEFSERENLAQLYQFFTTKIAENRPDLAGLINSLKQSPDTSDTIIHNYVTAHWNDRDNTESWYVNQKNPSDFLYLQLIIDDDVHTNIHKAVGNSLLMPYLRVSHDQEISPTRSVILPDNSVGSQMLLGEDGMLYARTNQYLLDRNGEGLIFHRAFDLYGSSTQIPDELKIQFNVESIPNLHEEVSRILPGAIEHLYYLKEQLENGTFQPQQDQTTE